MKKPSIKLVSVHIPKTGGTSFRNILKAVYGDEQVLRIDIKKAEGPLNPAILPEKTKIVHGHSPRLDLMDKYNIDDKVPAICWVRNPVDRVASNYFYMLERLNTVVAYHDRGPTLVKRLARSLEEYTQNNRSMNLMNRFVGAEELDFFLFVGITEFFEEDIHDLAFLLGWDSYPIFKHNVTESTGEVTEVARQNILDHNKADVAIYEKALKLRALRREALAKNEAYKNFKPTVKIYGIEEVEETEMNLVQRRKKRIWDWFKKA